MSADSEGAAAAAAADEPRELAADAFPEAAVRRRAGPGPRALLATRLWWLTAACALVAIALVVGAVLGGGPRITVRFHEGHGIEPGDALRHLGIEVGRVSAVELDPDLDGVVLTIELEEKAAGIAREGSRFWIERPRVSLSRVSGLDTVVGARYVVVRPGPAGARPASDFVGLETPPTLAEPAPLEITIRFADGHGLARGDVLRHRGIDVGEVTEIRLDGGLDAVVVTVRLVESAVPLARRGSLFWIERPQVGFAGVRGLETIVGGRHLAVLPGPADAEPQRSFEGLDAAPAVAERPEGGLEIVLWSHERMGLEAGAPVTYRGVPVGGISSVGLSSDGADVEARAYIRPEFRRLVRSRTRFWSISGIAVDLGFTGVHMDVESLATIAAGGVAMATPDPPGDRATTGDRFRLEAEAPAGWRDWRPGIPIGSTLLPDGLAAPQPLRAALRWRERNYVGLTRDRQRDGWVLLVEGGGLLGPADVLTPVEDAKDGETVLALAGEELRVSAEALRPAGRIAVHRVEAAHEAFGEPWPRARVRAPAGPEDAVVVGDPRAAPLPLSVGRLAVGGERASDDGEGGGDGVGDGEGSEGGDGEGDDSGAWVVDPAMPLERGWHGAVVVSRRDGAVIGVLVVEDARAVVVPISEATLP